MNTNVPVGEITVSLMRVDRANGRPSQYFQIIDGENVELTEAEYLALGGEPKPETTDG